VGRADVQRLRDRRIERKRVINDMGVNRLETGALGERICLGELEEEEKEHKEDDEDEDEFEDGFSCVQEEDDEDDDEYEDGFSCVKERVREERETDVFFYY
jgi:hypothetical protein